MVTQVPEVGDKNGLAATQGTKAMTTTDSYEAAYLALASRPGMEALRGECLGCRDNPGRVLNQHYDLVPHEFCHGRGWWPLPPAERLGALARVASENQQLELYHLDPATAGWGCDIIDFGKLLPDTTYRQTTGEGPTPEAALTAALLSATDARADHGE
ncbi:MAG: hypothetical protein Q8R78_02400 [Candidatus Omnitrophota bacterium]|nr:hypothetical protein [Candidatus Omnitrophota bacterium]